MNILRRNLPLLLVGAMTSFATGQGTTLTVNGQTDPNNTKTTVTVAVGQNVSVLVHNSAQAGRRYGLYGAIATTGVPTGWYLGTLSGSDPFSIVTGIDTPRVESAFGGAIRPLRAGSDFVRLNAFGQAILTFTLPTAAAGRTFYLQAVVDPDPLGPASGLDLSNAVAIEAVGATREGVALISHGPSVDDVEFGRLEFFFSASPNVQPKVTRPLPPPPTGFTSRFTVASFNGVDLTNLNVDPISLRGIQTLHPHDYPAGQFNNRPNDLNVFAAERPALRVDNAEFPRIVVPEAGNVPEREILRCLDNATGEGFYLVINKGPNPLTPNFDYFPLLRLADATLTNKWDTTVALNNDGTRMAAIFHDVSGDRVYLFATDGSLPFNGARAVDVTPPDSVQIFGESLRLTTNHLFFVDDDGADDTTTLDMDGVNQRIHTVPMRTANPAAGRAVLFVPATGPTAAPGPVPDHFPPESLLVSLNGNVLVFIGADTRGTVINGFTVDFADVADWYSIQDASPQTVTNITEMDLLPNSIQTARMLFPGSGYNGKTGLASLSPDGSTLAFTANHDDDRDGLEDDELYAVRTDGSSVGNLIEENLTKLVIFQGRQNPEFDNIQDVAMVDDHTLLFWFGINTLGHGSNGDRFMDLYMYDLLTATHKNLTLTSGETDPTYVTEGTLTPEGYFYSPNGNFLYFLYGSSADRSTVSIGGFAIPTRQLFNVTGDLVSGSFTQSETKNDLAHGNNYSWHLVRGPGAFSSLAYFAAADEVDPNEQNVWLIDLDFPFVAIRMTDNPLAGSDVHTLVPSRFDLGCAFSFADATTKQGDVYFLDLTLGSLRNLTASGGSAILPDAAISFLPPGVSATGPTDPGLIYADGSAGAGNPTDARFTYIPLDGTADEFGIVSGRVPPGVLQIYHSMAE